MILAHFAGYLFWAITILTWGFIAATLWALLAISRES